MAFAQWYKKTGGVTFTFMGDGAINQGTHNEALNLASLYKLPCIFVVENNGVAMGTQIERHSAETDLAERGCGYNMPHRNVDGNDIDTVIAEFGKAVERGRAGEGPSYLVANTYRFRGHSMSDAMKYRTKEEMENAKLRDPISLYEVRLVEKGLLTEAQIEQMQEEISAEINAAVQQADAVPADFPGDGGDRVAPSSHDLGGDIEFDPLAGPEVLGIGLADALQHAAQIGQTGTAPGINVLAHDRTQWGTRIRFLQG